MELDWTTFLLEIANFLILVWLLQHFLYRPVTEFIARRRAETEEVRAGARRDREQAEQLRQQYETRLGDWAQERDAARQQLRQELERERARRLHEIKEAVEKEHKKAVVSEERRQREFRAQTEQEALTLGTRFAARLLARTSNAQSTAALADAVMEGIGALSAEQRIALQRAGATATGTGMIETAHPLEARQRHALEKALADLFGPREWQWRVVAELVSGVRITLGGWALAANVRDEFKEFTALIHGSPVA